MTTLSRTFSVLVSIGILVHTSGALAGQPVGDAQQSARDLLTGEVNRQMAIAHNSPRPPVGKHWALNIDPQEQARRLILGTPNVCGVADPTVAPALAESTRAKSRIYTDPQELARRMILGAEAAKTPRQGRSALAVRGGNLSR
jgi:hypothetical protein